MDQLSTKWLSQMETDDLAYNHGWQHMSSLENECFDFKPFTDSTTNITKHDYNQNINNYVTQPSQKPWKIDGAGRNASSNNSSSSTIISFGNRVSSRVYRESKTLENKKSFSSSSSFIDHKILENIYGETKRGVARTPEQAQDHVLAERKRREKMTQKFVALSTLIPGLKKLDKATVLGDAISYIKELQGRVKELEVEVKENHIKEEAITIRAVKRPKLISSYDSDASSYDDNNNGIVITDNEISPEIEVRISEGIVMIRVCCKNQTGVIKEVMGKIEKNSLSMISSSAMPFGLNSLHMTIIAKIDADCELIPKDLAENLRRSILNLI